MNDLENAPEQQAAPDCEGNGEQTKKPAIVIRAGAIAASVWRREAKSGRVYYEYTLSRSWKSTATGKSGYSQAMSAENEAPLVEVIQMAAAWIRENQPHSTSNEEVQQAA